MPRRNKTTRRPQARRKADGTHGSSRAPAPDITQMVVPKGRCHFRTRNPKGKLIFTEAEAERALKQAQASRARRGSAYAEERTYACPEGGCGGWHLTSRSTYQQHSVAP